MKSLEQLQKDYARLLIREGLNIQKGQRLVIHCPVDCAAFARLCADEGYAAGCRDVLMIWSDDYLTRAKFLHAADEVFDHVDPWVADMYNSIAQEGAAWLAIHADDPENLKGVDPDRIRRSAIAAGKAAEIFRKLETSSAFPWCVASIPTAAWAKTVFPDLSEAEATDKLWYAIFDACRVGGDAVADWQAHSDELQRRVEKLNSYNFRYLHYVNSIGTDLTVELPEGHYWAGGAEKCITSGVMFSANIPTEEVFTLPRRDGVNGTVVASKPLCHNGNIIDGFRMTLKDGKIVEVHADKGEDILQNAISVDEGASYFGEVALVPWDSPISRSGILFYNTLFDENASCHFAFGEAYPCINGAQDKSPEEMKALGVNESITHVDFMVGTADLSITGLTHDGKEVPVFVDGNFAF